MPRKDSKAPEARHYSVRINYTATEHTKISALATSARTPLAVLIRELSLGTSAPDRPRAVTISAVRFSRILGALHSVGDSLKMLVDLLEDGEDPRLEHWSRIEEKLARAIQRLTTALETL